jgi:hypothetical protein
MKTQFFLFALLSTLAASHSFAATNSVVQNLIDTAAKNHQSLYQLLTSEYAQGTPATLSTFPTVDESRNGTRIMEFMSSNIVPETLPADLNVSDHVMSEVLIYLGNQTSYVVADFTPSELATHNDLTIVNLSSSDAERRNYKLTCTPNNFESSFTNLTDPTVSGTLNYHVFQGKVVVKVTATQGTETEVGYGYAWIQ